LYATSRTMAWVALAECPGVGGRCARRTEAGAWGGATDRGSRQRSPGAAGQGWRALDIGSAGRRGRMNPMNANVPQEGDARGIPRMTRSARERHGSAIVRSPPEAAKVGAGGGAAAGGGGRGAKRRCRGTGSRGGSCGGGRARSRGGRHAEWARSATRDRARPGTTLAERDRTRDPTARARNGDVGAAAGHAERRCGTRHTPPGMACVDQRGEDYPMHEK